MAALPKMVWSCIVTDDTTTALCLARCSVTFFFQWGKSRGVRFYVLRAADADPKLQRPIQRRGFNNTREAGGPRDRLLLRRPRLWQDVVDKST